MTFYEAALEVLRRSGRPLHFKKITEVAIREELLSHVGKTPEVIMGTRLEQEVKKQADASVIRTRPGVFVLRDEVLERLNEEAAEREAAEAAAAPEIEEEEFEEEEEDHDDEPEDELEDEQEEEAAEASDDDDSDEDEESGGGRRRRRRRRGKRGSNSKSPPDESDSKSATESTGSSRRKSGRRRSSRRSSGGRKSGGRNSGGRKSGGRKSGGRSSGGRKSGGRKSGGNNSGGRSSSGNAQESRKSSRRGSRRSNRNSSKSNGADQGVDIEQLENERFDSISEAAYAVLQSANRKAMGIAELAEFVFGKKLIRFHTHDPEATLQSALVTDNQVRTKRGKRPHFAAYGGERWGLTEWGISDEGIENEKEIVSLADKLRNEAIEQLGEALLDLKPEAFEMVVMTLLERLDYGNLKVSKRTSDGDVFFTADWRRGFSDMRVCIQIVADEEISFDAAGVNELRETLEHYSASEGVIIHLGAVARDAVKASRNDDKAKVTVIDRGALVRLLVEQGIGVKTFNQPIVMVDNAFVDALKG